MAMSARSRDPLDLVSLRQLRYFVSAMRAHSFSAASRDASISQAALSEQIALLESTLDVQLFDRASGRAVATASGHELDRRVSAAETGSGDHLCALRGSVVLATLSVESSLIDLFRVHSVPPPLLEAVQAAEALHDVQP